MKSYPLVVLVVLSLVLPRLNAANTPATSPTPVLTAPPSAGLPRLPAVVRDESIARTQARLAWFKAARFGMFIHWGVYSVPAGSWNGVSSAEWIMNAAKIPVAQYKGLAKKFTASKYDPKAWAALAREAGMKYIVITAKHHEGFTLYDSAYSDWNAVKASAAGRDLLKPLTDAARADGLRIGLYYSQAQDWVNPGGSKGKVAPWDPAQNGDFDQYLAKVALPQVHELLDKYHPDILWWDTEYQMTPPRAKPFFDLVTSYPDVLINSRLGGGVLGDIRTSEQHIPSSATQGRVMEVNMTINNSWGYNAHDTNWKSARQLIRNLSDIAGLGSNYLLDVGPTAEGVIPAPEVDRLKAIGRWMKVNGEAIYGTDAGPWTPAPAWGRATQKLTVTGGETLYLHVWNWPGAGTTPSDGILLPGISQKPVNGKVLATGAPVTWKAEAAGLVVNLKGNVPDPDVSVVKLDFAKPLVVANAAALPADNGASGTLANPDTSGPK
jgi:alpha-L-fucosidase